MPNHIAWGSIELLHNVIRTQNHMAAIPLNEGGRPLPTVTYRAKVKLHGTNCAVQVTPEGIFCQSRTGMITPEADLKGFARWVASHAADFLKLPVGITVFGEWAGPGIEKGVALSFLPKKVFAVFAVQVGTGDTAQVVFDPKEILDLIGDVSGNAHVLPWQDEPVVMDFASRVSLEAVAAEMNRRVEAIEKEDPWVKATFGISGLGEGVVMFPVAIEGGTVPTHPDVLATYMWKAKGEMHRTAGTKDAVQVDASVVASAAEFVNLMVTPARLEQGVMTVCGSATRDPKFTGKFIPWVVADVKKESEAELEASGLTWSQVEKAVQTRAREWFLAR